MRLGGRHAVVTGGGTGIGAAIARALAAEGARVTVIGRRSEPLAAVAAAIAGQAYSADVTDRASLDHALAKARGQAGPVSILVNNAGAASSAPFARLSAADWNAAFAVNVEGAFHMIEAALPDLLASADGRVVTIASTAGLKGYAHVAPYVAAKHAAVGLSRELAAEFARTSLTFNAVCPGFTDTDIVADAAANISAKTGRSTDEARAELARFNPQGRLVEPAEVAAAVLWLCLPESRSVTGQAIAVAGGEV